MDDDIENKAKQTREWKESDAAFVLFSLCQKHVLPKRIPASITTIPGKFYITNGKDRPSPFDSKVLQISFEDEFCSFSELNPTKIKYPTEKTKLANYFLANFVHPSYLGTKQIWPEPYDRHLIRPSKKGDSDSLSSFYFEYQKSLMETSSILTPSSQYLNQLLTSFAITPQTQEGLPKANLVFDPNTGTTYEKKTIREWKRSCFIRIYHNTIKRSQSLKSLEILNKNGVNIQLVDPSFSSMSDLSAEQLSQYMTPHGLMVTPSTFKYFMTNDHHWLSFCFVIAVNILSANKISS